MINANLDLMLCPASSLHPCRITVGIGMVCKSKTVAGILEFYWNIDNAKVLKTTPEIVEQETYDNSRSSNPLKDKFSFKKEISHVTTFSHEHGFEVDVGASYTFKAGITEIAETEESVHVDVSTSHTWKFGQDNVTTQTYEHESDVEVPPHKRVQRVASVTRGNLDVPYRAKIRAGDGSIQWIEGDVERCLDGQPHRETG